jgi:signal recognition particle receptor subunit beta
MLHYKRNYYHHDLQGVLFFIDGGDRTRLKEALESLKRTLEDPLLPQIPFVILINKQDLPNAISLSEFMTAMHAIQEREWHVMICSASTGEGLYEALDWLLTYINK